ncbi:MAG: DNA internalization-related competence protein ComEC/Rec2 [Fidelibacterota bacterium]|nr:MAG: DNA internalization-related competence protein ComEC/Rec2 [Candidatus Neomarinimicrobiota bacterium]
MPHPRSYTFLTCSQQVIQALRERFSLHIDREHPIFGQYPLLPAALALILGMCLGNVLAWPWGLWVGMAALGLILTWRWEGAVLLAILALGGWLAPQYRWLHELPPLETSKPYMLETVIREVQHRDSGTQVILDMSKGLPDSLCISRGVWNIYDHSFPSEPVVENLSPGDTLVLRCALQWPAGRRNPNGFDYRRYLWTRGVDILIRDPVIVVAHKAREDFYLPGVIAQVRQSIRAHLEAWLGQPQAGLAVGLLLGDKTGLDAEFRERIQSLGIGHILAVSGLHVGFMLAILMTLARLFPVTQVYRLIVIGTGLASYILLTGASPSVVRASIMAFLYAWGRSIERRPSGWNLLAAAAIISLILNPRSLFSASFQLSFAAVAGILYLYPSLRNWLASTPFGERVYRRRPLRYASDLFLVGLGAQAGILPVIISVFHSFSVYVLLANLLVIPLAGLVVMSGLVSLLVSVLWTGLAEVIANATWLFVTMIQVMVNLSSRLPYLQIVTGRPGVPALGGIIIGILIFPYLFRAEGFRIRIRLVAAMLVLVSIFVWVSATRERDLKVTVLDVGQGDAIHVAFPDGRHVLMDAGMRTPHFDQGRRVVAPYLRGQGVRRLYAAAISHPQADHLGGFSYLLERLPIRELWDTDNPHESGLYQRLKLVADSISVPVRSLMAGDVISIGKVDLFVLSPDDFLLRHNYKSNHASLVMKLRYGKTSMLFTGDVEKGVETRLLAYGEFLSADWLKVGHHGSSTSTSEAFLEICRPQGAVISVGAGNMFGHPSEEVVARLESAARVVHRTDRDRALVLRSDGERWEPVDWR